MFIASTNDVLDNSYLPLIQFENKCVLVNADNEFKIVSNVCPHQSSIISTCSGQGSRVCPFHGWGFDINGQPLGSGLTRCKNNQELASSPVHIWNNLIFTTSIDIKEMSTFDFSGLELKEQRVDLVNADHRNIMDLFLDVDHIPIVHKGVYDRIGIPNVNDINWIYYNNGSLQVVRHNNEIKSLWLALYPNTMIEWQPGALFVTVARPINDSQTNVIVYKYHDTTSKVPWTLNEDVWEIAWSQDKAQAELIVGFNNKNLDPGKQHFREWLNK